MLKSLRLVILIAATALASSAFAEQAIVVTKTQTETEKAAPAAGKTTDPMTQLDAADDSQCSVEPVGQCGACAISCLNGKKASCSPGKAEDNKNDQSACLVSPKCSCE